MDIKTIKDLASKYSTEQLLAYVDELEQSGKTSCPEGEGKADPGELMGDFLQAAEVRALIDKGLTLTEAVREFSKRVRSVFT